MKVWRSFAGLAGLSAIIVSLTGVRSVPVIDYSIDTGVKPSVVRMIYVGVVRGDKLYHKGKMI